MKSFKYNNVAKINNNVTNLTFRTSDDLKKYEELKNKDVGYYDYDVQINISDDEFEINLDSYRELIDDNEYIIDLDEYEFKKGKINYHFSEFFGIIDLFIQNTCINDDSDWDEYDLNEMVSIKENGKGSFHWEWDGKDFKFHIDKNYIKIETSGYIDYYCPQEVFDEDPLRFGCCKRCVIEFKIDKKLYETIVNGLYKISKKKLDLKLAENLKKEIQRKKAYDEMLIKKENLERMRREKVTEMEKQAELKRLEEEKREREERLRKEYELNFKRIKLIEF
jgi:hypothetical protein